MARLPARAWATPLTIGAFVLMAGTGVLMFFDVNANLTTVVHQWFSWLFLLGAAGHLTANFRPLANHLRSGRGRAAVAVFGLVLAASLFTWGRVTGPQLKRPIEQALVDAPLSALARVAGTEPQALLLRLKAHGIAATAEQSVRQLSAERRMSPNRLLGIVFLPD